MKTFGTITALLGFMALTGAVSAQDYGDRYYRGERIYQGGSGRLNPLPYVGPSDKYGYPASGPGACQKLCPGDNNPCDPLYFKQADGRCARDRW